MIKKNIQSTLDDKPMLNRRVVGIALALLAGAAIRGASGKSASGAAKDSNRLYRQHKSMLIYYGDRYDTIPDSYSLVVLEDRESARSFIRQSVNSTILGYVSIAEVHSGRPFYAQLRSKGVLGAANPNWPDAYYVDVRNENWRNLLLNEIIPSLISAGYQGIFLDTVDSAEALEREDPVRWKGMILATASLIRSIRSSFPAMQIMINRGYAVLPHIPGEYDYLLGESVRSTFDPQNTGYRRVSEQDVEWQRAKMLEARDRDPGLQLFALDYWDPNDRAGLISLYAEERADGFVPYIATPDLTQIVSEPVQETNR